MIFIDLWFIKLDILFSKIILIELYFEAKQTKLAEPIKNTTKIDRVYNRTKSIIWKWINWVSSKAT